MRFPILATAAAILATAACENSTATEAAPTYRLKATVTETNDCTVSVMNKSYSSKGQIRGDVPTQFVGTVPEQSYHGFGCWVATTGGDGDLVVLFSGNNLGKPLAVGTYSLNLDVFDNTPLGHAAVSFRPSDLGGDKLRTMDNAVGSVVVDSTAAGARRITIDADVVRWTSSF